jgi:hypothetical protein
MCQNIAGLSGFELIKLCGVGSWAENCIPFRIPPLSDMTDGGHAKTAHGGATVVAAARQRCLFLLAKLVVDGGNRSA